MPDLVMYLPLITYIVVLLIPLLVVIYRKTKDP